VTCKKFNNRDGCNNKNIYYKAATASRATAEQNKTNSFILIEKKLESSVTFLEKYIGYSKIRMKQWSHKRGS